MIDNPYQLLIESCQPTLSKGMREVVAVVETEEAELHETAVLLSVLDSQILTDVG